MPAATAARVFLGQSGHQVLAAGGYGSPTGASSINARSWGVDPGRTGVRRSGTNADDRLPLASLGRVQGGDGIVEGRDVVDVRPQSSVPHALDDLTQLGAIGLDDEVDREAVGRLRLGRPDDGHQCSSGSNEARRPLADVAADAIETQSNSAHTFPRA